MTQRGFSLVEISIVLVIVGLLLGAVLRGQSLIDSARVRNLINQQEAIKTAFYAFQDRFRALPGDYQLASQMIPDVPAWANGNGDGEIGGAESLLAWMHLSRAGFISGAYAMAGVSEGPNQANSPANPFGGLLTLANDAEFAGATSARLNLSTGGQVPATVLAEVDRKTDDGNPATGAFRATQATAVPANGCVIDGRWAATDARNCGGAYLF